MATTVQHRRSETTGSEPAAGDILVGELAVNLADGKLFSKKTDGTIVTLAGNLTATTYYIPTSLGYITETPDFGTDFGLITASVGNGNTQETNTSSDVTFNSVTSNGKVTVTYSPATTTGSAIEITTKDTRGGTGYADFLAVTNSTSGATNPNKYFRINNIGTMEVINSAYSASILALTNGGNLSTAGTIIPGAYTAGQVIKDTMLDNTQFTVNTTTVATSTSDTDFITYNYTPVSSSSYLIIHVHVASYYDGGGTGDDSYFSRIKVDGNEITYSRQATRNNYTFRTGTLFPLTGRYTNSNTTAKSITVGVRRDSADDNITIVNSGTALWMRITEIAR